MNLTILTFILVASAASIIYGKKYGHLEMSLVGFAFLFVLGLAIAGNSLMGVSAGIDYQTGINESYTYLSNSSDIDYVSTDYVYTNYQSTFLGSWIAIISFLGALGIILGETIWKRKL